MDFVVRVDIEINGIAEEDVPLEMDKILRGGYVQYPSWVDESKVKAVRNLKCFEAVREMLLNGMPTIEAARQVQLLGEWVDKKLDNVRINLTHFRETLPKAQMLARMAPAQYLEVKQKVDQGLSQMSVLEEALTWQRERVLIGLKKERAMDFLMPNGSKEILALVEVAKTLHELKKDLAGNQVDIALDMQKSGGGPKVDWSKIYSTPDVNKIMENPASRTRLVKFAENMAKLYGNLPPDKMQEIIEAAKKKLELESADENQVRVNEA